MKKFFYLSISIAKILLFSTCIHATELVYTPVNPSFGGNSLNGSFLMSNAEAQNDTKAPAKTQATQLEEFTASLNRQVLSQLARKIVSTSFGDYNDDLASGHYDFGDYSMDINVADGDKISVSITDIMTGGTTTIDVPYYQ